jgi:anthranilate synthase/aminodeoxychorismate synthase-like glutamine amidotransferase
VRRILVIDNYDSFVYNLVQYLGELGADPIVVRNDEITVDAILENPPDGILVSPGPGNPDQAGISNEVILRCGEVLPVFGVCLGLQCIGQVFGGDVIRAPEIVHGKTSFIEHHGVGVFTGLPSPIEATRYHSLIVDRSTLPNELEITAETSDGLIMGLRHRELSVEGVQFHPESILTAHGHTMVRNFLDSCGRVLS